jgi:hypothetical protein
LALFDILDSVPNRCFLIVDVDVDVEGEPFFFTGAEEVVTLRFGLDVALSVVSQDFLLVVELDTVSLLEVELELVSARRLVFRVEHSELETLSVEVLTDDAEDAGLPLFVFLAGASDPLERLAEDVDTADLDDSLGDFLRVCLARIKESLETLVEVANTARLFDLFVMRCAVSLSEGVLLLNIEAFVDDTRPLAEVLFLDIDGVATTGDHLAENTGERTLSFFVVVPRLSVRGVDLDLALFLADTVITSFAFLLP